MLAMLIVGPFLSSPNLENGGVYALNYKGESGEVETAVLHLRNEGVSPVLCFSYDNGLNVPPAMRQYSGVCSPMFQFDENGGETTVRLDDNMTASHERYSSEYHDEIMRMANEGRSNENIADNLVRSRPNLVGRYENALNIVEASREPDFLVVDWRVSHRGLGLSALKGGYAFWNTGFLGRESVLDLFASRIQLEFRLGDGYLPDGSGFLRPSSWKDSASDIDAYRIAALVVCILLSISFLAGLFFSKTRVAAFGTWAFRGKVTLVVAIACFVASEQSQIIVPSEVGEAYSSGVHDFRYEFHLNDEGESWAQVWKDGLLITPSLMVTDHGGYRLGAQRDAFSVGRPIWISWVRGRVRASLVGLQARSMNHGLPRASDPADGYGAFPLNLGHYGASEEAKAQFEAIQLLEDREWEIPYWDVPSWFRISSIGFGIVGFLCLLIGLLQRIRNGRGKQMGEAGARPSDTVDLNVSAAIDASHSNPVSPTKATLTEEGFGVEEGANAIGGLRGWRRVLVWTLVGLQVVPYFGFLVQGKNPAWYMDELVTAIDLLFEGDLKWAATVFVGVLIQFVIFNIFGLIAWIVYTRSKK